MPRLQPRAYTRIRQSARRNLYNPSGSASPGGWRKLKKKVLILSGVLLVLGAVFVLMLFLNKGSQGRCVSGNCKNGIGVRVFRDGTKYEGAFRNRKPHGYGKFSTPTKHYYDGLWRNGKKHGRGKYVYPGGAVYSGEFVENKKHGQGTYIWSDNTRYSGSWKNGEPEGEGVVILASGVIMRGMYRRGKIWNGRGIFIYDDGSRYVGSWKDGKRNGEGMMLDDHGGLMKKGVWQNDKLIAPSRSAPSAETGGK